MVKVHSIGNKLIQKAQDYIHNTITLSLSDFQTFRLSDFQTFRLSNFLPFTRTYEFMMHIFILIS